MVQVWLLGGKIHLRRGVSTETARRDLGRA